MCSFEKKVVYLYWTFLHVSACFDIRLQLILTVRPSPPPHNPSNVFGSFADSYTGNFGSSSNLDDNTKEVLKVISLFRMLLFPAVFDGRRMRCWLTIFVVVCFAYLQT